MKTYIGRKEVEVDESFIEGIKDNFKKIHVDIGTGDGRFVYKSAKENPNNFYIGVEPIEKQFEIYAKKARKDNLENCMFVVGSAEVFPEVLLGVATSISVLLPWGSLLQSVVLAPDEFLQLLENIFQSKGGKITIIFGYSQESEPGEFERLDLDTLNTNYIYSEMLPKYIKQGFKIECLRELSKEDLKDFETTWSKKLSFGSDRKLFYLQARVDIL